MPVEVGALAPPFELRDQHLAAVRLEDFRPARAVLVVFYPWSFTPVCTGELQQLRADLAGFHVAGVEVLGVSCDAPATQRAFAEAEGLTFPLLSDFWPHGEVAQRYGVFNPAVGAALRGSFLIDTRGVVRYKVVNDLPDARDPAAYRAAVAEL